MNTENRPRPSFSANRDYAVCIARALGGALLFSLPILMTMETWQLGFSMDRLRLAALLVSTLPLLVGLAYFLGFEETTSVLDAVLDAFAAIAVAVVLAALILIVFGVLGARASWSDVFGKLALQSIPGSIGALLAQSQFGKAAHEDRKRREGGSFAEYFFMAAGALFLSANVAPTEEVVLIAYKMSAWHALALVMLSLAIMHAFVYAVGFKGQHERAAESAAGEFLHFTVIGYLLSLAISAYLCWSFGRFDGLAAAEMLRISIVLAFPAAIGAASARLVL